MDGETSEAPQASGDVCDWERVEREREVGNWKLEFGSWSLEVGVWKLELRIVNSEL